MTRRGSTGLHADIARPQIVGRPLAGRLSPLRLSLPSKQRSRMTREQELTVTAGGRGETVDMPDPDDLKSRLRAQIAQLETMLAEAERFSETDDADVVRRYIDVAVNIESAVQVAAQSRHPVR
jgi:hypothetical protein